jgi:hypothetical protein
VPSGCPDRGCGGGLWTGVEEGFNVYHIRNLESEEWLVVTVPVIVF